MRDRIGWLLGLLLVAACSDDPVAVVTSIRIEPPAITVDRFRLGTYRVVLGFSDGNEGDGTQDAIASGTNAAVFELAGPGTIFGVAAGSSALTASAGGYEATASVTVEDRQLSSLDISPRSAAIAPGAETTLELLGALTDGTTRNLADMAEWTSSDLGVATVEAGHVVGVANGEARIEARLDDQLAEATIRVGPNRFKSSPRPFATDVAVRRETFFTFDYPLADSVIPTNADVFAEAAGQPLAARLQVSADRRRLTLFYPTALPGNTRVRVTIVGDRLLDATGAALDADGDGQPGGTAIVEFDTVSLTLVPGTVMVGRVYASELGATGSVDVPLEGVNITVDGIDPAQLSARSDAAGDFRLEPAPAGRFFVHIDGRTATGSGDGAYYAFVNKAWVSEPETEVRVPDIYLPKVSADTLHLLSPTEATTIHFPPSVLGAHPEMADVQIVVPKGALYADDGTVGGAVGIAPVPPDRIPSPLPESLKFPLVITVQTDGPSNFDAPVEACFPNLPLATGETLPPGARTSLWSFDHDLGDWTLAAPAEISADGKLACTLPGTGIRTPGWHAVDPDVPIENDPDPPKTPPRPPRTPAPMPDMMCKPQPDVSVFDVASTITSCLKLFINVTGPLKGLISLIKEGKLIAANIASLTTGYLEHNLPAAGLVTAFEALGRAKKEVIKSIAESLAIVNPLAKAGDAISCASDALGVLQPKCDAFVACDMGNWELLAACASLSELRNLLRTVETLLRYVNTFLVSAGFTPVCAALDLAKDKAKAELAMSMPLTVADSPDLVAAFEDLRSQAEMVAAIEVPEITVVTKRIVAFSFAAGLDDFQAFGGAPGAYVLINVDGFVRRYRASSSGAYGFTVRQQKYYSLQLLDPATLRCGTSMGYSAPGVTNDSPGVALGRCGEVDTDDDELTDEAELIVGTSSTTFDTDGDGIGDGAEVRLGANPLSGIASRIGVMASVDTPDSAVDICSGTGFVAVADTSSLRVYLIDDRQQPILSDVIDARVVRVACDGRRVAAVGEQTVFYDFTTRQSRLLPRSGLGVAFAGEQVVVGEATGVSVLDFASARPIDRIARSRAEDVAYAAGLVYALGDDLSVYRLDPHGLRFVRGNIAVSGLSPFHGRRLTLGNGQAWGTHRFGFDHYDLANPVGPVADLHQSTAPPAFNWSHLSTDGSGLGVAAASINSTDSAEVWVYELARPEDGRLDVIPTPGDACAVAIHQGRAYVADGPAGFQVVNYRSPDLGRVSPTVSMSVAPAAIEVGQRYDLIASASDDNAVRSVRFFVDGVRVVEDGSFPFRVTLKARATPGVSTAIVSVFDTGNNTTVSSPFPIPILADTTSPTIIDAGPTGVTTSTSVARFVITFSESMDTSIDVGAAIVIAEAGPDGIFGQADDVPLVGWTAGLSNVEGFGWLGIELAAPLPEGRYRVSLGSGLVDNAGRPLAPTSFALQIGNAQSPPGVAVAIDPATGSPATSTTPWISGDGRWVGFTVSNIYALTPDDINGVSDAYLYDASNGALTWIDTLSSGATLRGLSADLRYLAFWSNDGGLVAGDTNSNSDVFLLDRTQSTFTRASLDVAGNQLAFGAFNGMISDSGRYVAYGVRDNLGFESVYRWDRMTDTRVLCSLDLAGLTGVNAFLRGISDQGEVAFEMDGVSYLRDPDLGVSSLLYLDENGLEATGASRYFGWSADGSHYAYTSDGRLLIRDRGQASATVLVDGLDDMQGVSISDDGQRVLYSNRAGLWLYDKATTLHRPLTLDPQVTFDSYRELQISADGTAAALIGSFSKSFARVYRLSLP